MPRRPASITVLPIGATVRLHGDGPEALVTGIKLRLARGGHAVLYEVTYFDSTNTCQTLTVEEIEIEAVAGAATPLRIGFAIGKPPPDAV
jgi:hypothetical protein